MRLPGSAEAVEVPILRRSELTAGQRIAGPAIIEQPDTTTLLDSGWRARVGAGLTLILEPEAEA